MKVRDCEHCGSAVVTLLLHPGFVKCCGCGRDWPIEPEEEFEGESE
jgi:hypothetical protein